jgi:hypothetical protein
MMAGLKDCTCPHTAKHHTASGHCRAWRVPRIKPPRLRCNCPAAAIKAARKERAAAR